MLQRYLSVIHRALDTGPPQCHTDLTRVLGLSKKLIMFGLRMKIIVLKKCF